MDKFSLNKRRETSGLRDYEAFACPEVPCPEVPCPASKIMQFNFEQLLIAKYFGTDTNEREYICLGTSWTRCERSFASRLAGRKDYVVVDTQGLPMEFPSTRRASATAKMLNWHLGNLPTSSEAMIQIAFSKIMLNKLSN